MKYYTITQFIEKTNGVITRAALFSRIRRGCFPEVVKDKKGQWAIPEFYVNEVIEKHKRFERELEGYIPVSEVCKMSGLRSETITNRINDGFYKEVKKSENGRNWFILKELAQRIADIANKEKEYENYVSGPELAKMLGVSGSTIQDRVSKGKYTNYVKNELGRIFFPPDEVEKLVEEHREILKNEKGYVSVSKVSEISGIFHGTLNERIVNGWYDGVKKSHNNKWLIPEEEAKKIIDTANKEKKYKNYTSGPELARILGLSTSTIQLRIADGKYTNYVRDEAGRTFFPPDEVERIVGKENEVNWDEYISIGDLSRETGIKRATILNWIYKGKYPNSKQSFDNKWNVTLEDAEKIRKEGGILTDDFTGYATIKEVVKAANYEIKAVTLVDRINRGYYPDAIKDGRGRWNFPYRVLHEIAEEIKLKKSMIHISKLEEACGLKRNSLNPRMGNMIKGVRIVDRWHVDKEEFDRIVGIYKNVTTVEEVSASMDLDKEEILEMKKEGLQVDQIDTFGKTSVVKEEEVEKFVVKKDLQKILRNGSLNDALEQHMMKQLDSIADQYDIDFLARLGKVMNGIQVEEFSALLFYVEKLADADPKDYLYKGDVDISNVIKSLTPRQFFDEISEIYDKKKEVSSLF